MNNDKELVTQRDLITIIVDFVTKSTGLSLANGQDGAVCIQQKNDSKQISFKKLDLADVLVRRDADGREFVQVNMNSGRKILLTDQLVGFKPHPVSELDISKLPKVVTTLDLISVFEAIEESVTLQAGVKGEETEALKKVFNSILMGGEEAGFDLTTERSWLKRLPGVVSKTSA